MILGRRSTWPVLVLALCFACDAADAPERELGPEQDARDGEPGDGRTPSAGAQPRDAGNDAVAPGPRLSDAATSAEGGSSGPARSADADVPAQSGAADAGKRTRDSGVVAQPLPGALRDAGVVSLFPGPALRDVCPDPALRIGFEARPALGSAGKLQVFDAAEPRTAVASVDLAAKSVNDVRGGVTFAMERPAYIDGNTAVFYLPSGALRPGRSYFVHVDKGVVAAAGGRELAIGDDVTWTFSTAISAPSGGPMLTVALDGSGDFCSLQGALDAASNGSTIIIEPGTYHGIVYFKSKRDLTIRGADRKSTLLVGTNNENMNGGTAKRALIGVDASSGISFENLTIHNLTPQGGSQAEALRMQNCDRCSVRDADIVSLQDTLLWSGRVYAKNCYIAGNVDFIWGTGAAYFDHCEIKTLGRKGYNVQARNGAGGYGYVFVDSKLTSDPGITGTFLGRVDGSEYPASHVAYVDCELGKHIDPAGWQVTGGGGSVRFWEYRSKDPSGAATDVSRRHASSKQITEAQAAMMRDPSVVLGGWSPQ
jgi:pectin methylesterase-like acyl-CoA thioesterase